MWRKLAILSLGLLLAACAGHQSSQQAAKDPQLGANYGVEPKVVFSDDLLSEVAPGTPASARKAWHGFIVPSRYYAKNQSLRQATLPEVIQDLLADKPRLFSSEIARTRFVWMVGMRLGEDFDSRQEVADLLNSEHKRVTVCKAGEKLDLMAYDNASTFTWAPRDCAPGEKIVEVRVNGEWQPLFSLGCLNPVDGLVTKITPDPCPVRWDVPGGAPARDDQKVIFVPGYAKKCLPPTLQCSYDCEQWAWGNRGKPARNDNVREGLYDTMLAGGSAYYLLPTNGEGGDHIRLPKQALQDEGELLLWCDRDYHDIDEAEFMRNMTLMSRKPSM